MDKHQAEAIANAMLTRDSRWKDKTQRQRDWHRTKKTLFNYGMAGAILGLMLRTAVQYFFVSGSVTRDSTTASVEWGACAGVIVGFGAVWWRHFVTMRSRKRSTQQRLSEQLHGYSEHHA